MRLRTFPRRDTFVASRGAERHMQRTLLFIVIVSCIAACNRQIKYKPYPESGSYLRTDSALTHHQNPADKSSTGAGIFGY